MLYLEDFIESTKFNYRHPETFNLILIVIDNLPADLRDRFTEIRELDLKQNKLNDEARRGMIEFFNKIKSNKNFFGNRDSEYKKRRKKFDTVISVAEKKVVLSNEVYEFLGRYISKLDQDIEHFRLDLEQSKPGIIAIVEKRLQQQENRRLTGNVLTKNFVNKKKKDRHKSFDNGNSRSRREVNTENGNHKNRRFTLSNVEPSKQEAEKNEKPTKPINNDQDNEKSLLRKQIMKRLSENNMTINKNMLDSLLVNVKINKNKPTENVDRILEDAASKAMIKTLNSTQYRRSRNDSPQKFDQTLTNADTMKLRSRNSLNLNRPKNFSYIQDDEDDELVQTDQKITYTETIFENGKKSTQEIVTSNTEPHYCFCNKINIGEMVGCDNPECKVEWFHYACVGLTGAPEGAWYCFNCKK
ncbi:hypothetical protein A3Q56_05837 [Intoshia linei]|uniref:Inhibitor of growth protein n=1 Tax=Intoshia linei TaxID=1819745 RepID=A0A177AYJ1_9BILA|nr:hypothetical protein A3Q56_05837 [Intoshia linei]